MKNIMIITGANKGIGAAIAQKFLTENWRVINIARGAEHKDAIEKINCDLADLTQLEKKIKELLPSLQDAKKISLVHNASWHGKDTIKNIQTDAFLQSLTVNLIAPNILNQILIPQMPSSSSIIYLGSTLSEKAVPGAASYVIDKHAIVGMMRATCQDLAAEQIHTCCVCPGFTNTEMLQKHLAHDPELLKSVSARVGANRLIEPSEIADVAFFAANNPVINGSVIHANLGQIES